MIDSIVSAMKIGEVEIEYTSLISGNSKKVVGTLKNKALNQSNTNERIVFWDINSQKYEDIKIDTITSWEVCK
jgi:hypothetical protein